MSGLIHLYTGDGKGKTTAALGLALRAAGRGRKVLILQFLKGRDTGELHTLSLIPDITVLRLSRDYGFFKYLTGDEQADVLDEHGAMLAKASEAVAAEECNFLVLDELAATLRHELVDEAALLELLDNRPAGVEVVTTGRDAPNCLTRRADYITEMRKIKHPFDDGVPAREGIEW